MAITGDLSDTTALITGGSRGIGAAIATAYAKAGAKVFLVARKAEGLAEFERKLRDAGIAPQRIAWSAADAADPDVASTLVAGCIERFGSLDVLVNNAATNPYVGRVIDIGLDAWDRLHRVNLRGPLAWSQAAWRAWMRDHEGCSIINVASIGAFMTSDQIGAYDIFKAALVDLTRQLAFELGPNVRVNALAPGVIQTRFSQLLWDGPQGDKLARTYPLRRLGVSDDIAEAALFLASGASWMTGQCLVVDGGHMVRPPI